MLWGDKITITVLNSAGSACVIAQINALEKNNLCEVKTLNLCILKTEPESKFGLIRKMKIIKLCSHFINIKETCKYHEEFLTT
jgi:hypothetical protein